MACDRCSELEKRLQLLEAKLAKLTGTPEPEPAKPPAPKAEAPPPPPPPPPPPAAAEAPPPATANVDEAEKLTALGIPAEFHGHAVRALAEYPNGLGIIAPQIGKTVPGPAIFHAAYAAEKAGKESVERVLSKLFAQYTLEPSDLPHAADADKIHGLEATEFALGLGYRRRDIAMAAEVIKMWPRPPMGRDALQRMQKMFTKVRADVMGEDLRYCAIAYQNLGEDFLERAIRDRHPKNEREIWPQGVSIPLLAWAYKMSAPHTGPAIDDCRKRNVRRDRVGHEVLSALGRKFGRKVPLPPWMGGKSE